MTPKFDSVTIGLAAVCVFAAIIYAFSRLNAPTVPAVPGSQSVAEVPGWPQLAAPALNRPEPAPAAVAPITVKPATAPKAAASKAKAAPKTAKPATPTLEDISYLMAAFYAQHAACLRELVDYKYEMDVKAGKIQDFGNVRESGLCGYDYFDPETGRLPPAEVTLKRLSRV